MSAGEKVSSPLGIFIFYMLGSFLAIFAWTWFFPGGREPLAVFHFGWRFWQAVIRFVDLFPALAFAALVIPFGLKESSEGGYAGDTFVGNKSFSPRFLEYITWPVITACFAAAVYGLLFFAALPIAQDNRYSMTNRSALYRDALARAENKAAAGDWAEASQLLAMCDQIWPKNDEVEKLKKAYSENINAYRSQAAQTAASRDETAAGEPVSAAEAMALAQKAFAEENWYDAHWLATLAERLAGRGSAEAGPAQALAARAWNKIGELEPSMQEKERAANYRLKRDGYEALLSGDWISAYYTFRELSVRTPDDPDVKQYLATSTALLADVAFFMDETERTLGDVLHDPVFSVPSEDGGRLVLRFGELALLHDNAYAWKAEGVLLDANGAFKYRASSEYGKVVPVFSGSGEETPRRRSSLLLRALDRTDGARRWEPAWYDASGAQLEESAGSQILLDISFDDFLLLARIKQGMNALSLRELFTAEKSLRNAGYMPEMFRAEILRRLSEPVFLLPMAVLALFLGWRYRARRKPRYVYVPMLFAMPLVFHAAVLFYRSILNNASIWLALSFTFKSALLLFAAASFICFIVSLIVLAAQHG
jgi:hypothetical protein